MRIGAGFAITLAVCAGCAGHPVRSVDVRGPAQQTPVDRSVDVTAAWDSRAPAHSSALGPPLSLKVDGQELPLRDLDVRGVVLGPLAFTELRLVFDAPTDPRATGTFDLALPAGAAVARFAILRAHGWQEAEMVAVTHDEGSCDDRMARRALNLPVTTLATPHRTSHFVARVGPIAAESRETMLVSFAQPLPIAGEPYRLSLAGLGRVDRFDGVVHFPLGAGSRSFSVHKEGWTADRDWIVDAPSPQPDALRSGRFVVARVVLPIAQAAEDPLDGSMAVLVDTSASRALDLASDSERLVAVLREMSRTAPRATVDVAAFDQDVEPVYAGPAAGFGASEIGHIAAREALGATDLHRALQWAAARHADRLLLVSDGVATIGPRTATDLAPDLDAVRVAGARRIDAMRSLDDPGAAVLADLVSRIGPGDADGPEEPPATVVSRLSHAPSARVEVVGASWSWPPEVSAGTSALVYAELDPTQPLSIRVGGRPLPLEIRDDAGPLVGHEAARANAERLGRELATAPDDAERQRLRARLADLSTANRATSVEARWVVLDSEPQYGAFGIDRSAKDLLAVGPMGVEATARPPLDLAPPASTDPGSAHDAGPPVRPEPGEQSGCFVRVQSETMPGSQVLFDKGSERVAPAQLSALVENLQWHMARANPRVGPGLEVEGYSDESANETENLRASRARALAFRDVLVKAGVRAAALRVRGYGSMPPLVHARSLYRWSRAKGPVEVRVVGVDPPKPLTQSPTPFTGDLAEILGAASGSDKPRAKSLAEAWHARAPSDPMTAFAIGMAERALDHPARASRAFGSLVDLSPSDPRAYRTAAAFLDHDAPATALDLLRAANAIEGGNGAASHRALAMALARAGRLDDSVAEMAASLRAFESDESWFATTTLGVVDVLREDLGILAAAAARARPGAKAEIEARLLPFGVKLATRPSLRFVLSWESDSDVDLQVDAAGHPWDPGASIERDPSPGEGLRLTDVKAFGPEAYVVGGWARAFPYRIRAHLQGPAGNVLGRLDVIEYDGFGHVALEERPFVVQTEGGTVDLAIVRGPLIHAR